MKDSSAHKIFSTWRSTHTGLFNMGPNMTFLLVELSHVAFIVSLWNSMKLIWMLFITFCQRKKIFTFLLISKLCCHLKWHVAMICLDLFNVNTTETQHFLNTWGFGQWCSLRMNMDVWIRVEVVSLWVYSLFYFSADYHMKTFPLSLFYSP